MGYCVSSIRREGLATPLAAERLTSLLVAARAARRSGVHLKLESSLALVGDVPLKS